MYKLKITLRSDLCAAGGDGFSAIIDTDVCCDRYGFPFIGGRRLKGCLYDAAKLIGISDDRINEIFGVSGASEGGSLRISDAVIKDRDALKNDASKYPSESIISLFTYVRSSTAIENDTAKDGSLRFTRAVKHYSPVDGKETEFYADVDIDEKYADEFGQICRALRNIGYKRNRGFGAVSSELIRVNAPSVNNAVTINDEEDHQIKFTVLLKSNVMIPGSSSDETVDHIPGTSVMGFFANEYLKKHDDDSCFEEIFLKDNVRFSNLCISDKDGTEYFPAAAVFGKVKGESGTFNILKYNAENKIIKPVKNGFCDLSHEIVKPLTETVYHHSTRNDPELYTQTSLCAGQYFSGTVSGKGRYIKEMIPILTGAALHFGRSKTAQYSACELIHSEIAPKSEKALRIRKGEVFIVLAVSDILVCDNAGGYDISAEGLKKAVGNGIEKLQCDNGLPSCRSVLRYRTIGGYNTKWNIQKPQIRAIAAGSTLVFTAEEDMTINERLYVGAKQNEGFGNILIRRADDIPAVLAKKDAENVSGTKGILYGLISDNELINEMRSKAIDYVNNMTNKNINTSQIGRYILMIKHSKDLSELTSLVRNIKSEKSKEFIDKLIKNSEASHFSCDVVRGREMWREYLILILTLLKYEKRGEEQQ